MYVPRPQDRRKRRVTRLVIAVVFTVAGLVFGWVAVDEARGGVVDAEVVGISYNGAGRRVYDVRFEVAGRVCSSRVDSGSKPKPRDVRIGGISRLRYPASDPCRKVRETIAAGPGPMPFIAAVVALGFWVGVWRLRPSRPTADRSN
ncbi:hypothetical protein [Dactylosporangium sp. NPDC005555]|uniref:hypothetical protein n=1 Tax=Dactylosporangium sp. NPDC005555 TaxID=3154889 RepID=UPI0033B2CAA1